MKHDGYHTAAAWGSLARCVLNTKERRRYIIRHRYINGIIPMACRKETISENTDGISSDSFLSTRHVLFRHSFLSIRYVFREPLCVGLAIDVVSHFPFGAHGNFAAPAVEVVPAVREA